MRIAFLNPTYWPEVRRGSERLVHDLATALAGRGHEITLFTTHPGPPTSEVEEGVRVVRSPRLPQPRTLRAYEYHLTNAPVVAWQLLRGDFDLAHAFFPSDAWAAVGARRLGGPPVVFSVHGIPTRRYLVVRRYRLTMFAQAVRGAATTTVLSEAAAAAFHRYLLTSPVVIPGGVRTSDYKSERSPASTPTLLCAASLNDPRKRAPVLFEAFERLRRTRPNARLLLAGRDDPMLDGGRRTLPEGAERAPADDTPALAALYAEAWASVLPAVEEAFGLVLVESLAAGTPVVAARSGACPEVLTSDRVGHLFAPDDPADLARALDEALDLGRSPGIADACREHARAWDWASVAPRFERLYEEVVGR